MLTASVIGCGFGGGLSLDALRHSEDYELVAACDLSADRRAAVAARFPGIRLFDNAGEMLRDAPAGVVCVATPAPTHVPVSRAVVDHDVRGLLVEKPLSLDWTSAGLLIDELARRRLPVTVPHGMLTLPAPQEVKARVQRGELGRIREITVTSGVDLMNAGIHWLVYLLDLLGDDGMTFVDAEFDVSGRLVNDGAKVESRGLTRLRSTSGIRVTLHSGRSVEPRSEVLPAAETRGAIFNIAGTSGTIELSAWAGSYWIDRDGCKPTLERRPLQRFLNYHEAMLADLARQIVSDTPDYRVALLSLEALRLIESAYRQSRQREWPLGTAEDVPA